MKKLTLLFTVLTGACLAANAQAIGSYPGCPGAFGATKLIQGGTRSNTIPNINTGGTVNWDKDTIYILKGIVRVGAGTTLSLEAGTIVMGFPGPLDTSALIINQGAKLNVNGTYTNPVVMTSCKLQGARNRGDWGGLVITGNAVSNLGVNQVLEGNYGATFGGTDPEDNSGEIQCLRVEFAGFALDPNREMNGITLAAVGARTTFKFVQVSYSNDDSFEWFGGSVNGRFLIAYKGLDDDFDTDNGFNGIVQYGFAFRDYAAADFSGSNSFESDNNAQGESATVLLPKTSAIFSNMTSYGPLFKKGIRANRFFKTGALLRRNTEQDIYNSVFAGWLGDTTVNDGVQGGRETGGVYIFGTNASNNAISGNIRFKKNTVLQHATYGAQSAATDNVAFFNAQAWFATPAFFNVHSTKVGYYTPYQVNDLPPYFRIPAGSPLNTGSSFPSGTPGGPLNGDLPIGSNMFSANPALRGFTDLPFRGSHAATGGYATWDLEWAEYNPIPFKYTAGVVPTRKGVIDHFLSGNGEEAENGIVISPNPAVLNTEVKFVLDNATADAAISVLDMKGNVVYTESIMGGLNEINLNTANLEPGIYIVRVSANGTLVKSAKLNVVR